MTTLILQSIIGLILAFVAICAITKSSVLIVKVVLALTAAASVGMSLIIIAQFYGYSCLLFRDWYRVCVFVITASELAVIVSLREYSSWT